MRAYTITETTTDGRWVVTLNQHDSREEASEAHPGAVVFTEQRAAFQTAHRLWKSRRKLGDELSTPGGRFLLLSPADVEKADLTHRDEVVYG